MRQLAPKPALYYNKVYSVYGGPVGVGDVAILVSNLALPLILSGELSSWEFYEISDESKLIAASNESGVFVIDFKTTTFQRWTKHYVERDIDEAAIKFVCAGHPVVGSVPESAWVDLVTGQLYFSDEENRGTISTSKAEHHQLISLDI